MSMYDLPFFPISGGGSAEAGKDGVSPTITVTKTADGNRLTIVDAVGTKTVDIPNGTDGKSAFEIAKEAGYTGTESDFATKLSQENPTKVSQLENDNDYAPRSELPKLFEITITANGDDTYTASHYWADIKAAYDNGQIPVVLYNNNIYQLTHSNARSVLGFKFGLLFKSSSTYEEFKITDTNVTLSSSVLMSEDAVQASLLPMMMPAYLTTQKITDEQYTITGYLDGLITDTSEPVKKAYEAYVSGKNVFIRLSDIEVVYPIILASSETSLTFGACAGLGNVCISVENDVAYCNIWESPQALPNPNALIINNQRYDGSDEVNITISNKSAYDYATDGGYTGTEEEFTELLVNTIDKRNIKLGIHTDGLLYLFINGEPVGDGIEINV